METVEHGDFLLKRPRSVLRLMARIVPRPAVPQVPSCRRRSAGRYGHLNQAGDKPPLYAERAGDKPPLYARRAGQAARP